MVELVLKPGPVVDSSSTPCGVTSMPMARTTCGLRKVNEDRHQMALKLCTNINQSGCAGSSRQYDSRAEIFLRQQSCMHTGEVYRMRRRQVSL
jgi:hypothetical protein